MSFRDARKSFKSTCILLTFAVYDVHGTSCVISLYTYTSGDDYNDYHSVARVVVKLTGTDGKCHRCPDGQTGCDEMARNCCTHRCTFHFAWCVFIYYFFSFFSKFLRPAGRVEATAAPEARTRIYVVKDTHMAAAAPNLFL